MLVVKLAPEATVSVARAARAGGRRALAHPVAADLDRLVRSGHVRRVVPLLEAPAASRGRRGLARALAATSAVAGPGADLLFLDVDAGHEDRVAGRLGRQRDVAYAHRVPRFQLTAPGPDPLVNHQWGLRAIRWFEAPDVLASPAAPVAVVDTGVDLQHPDLQAAVSAARYRSTGSPADLAGHGTMVAGIIAATAGNALGVAGVAAAELLVFKCASDQPNPMTRTVSIDPRLYYRALFLAAAEPVGVVNVSLAAATPDPTHQQAIAALLQAGKVVVAGTGNDFARGNPRAFPAGFPGVIAVGAVDETLRRAPFSGTGTRPTLYAPGTAILSTLPLAPSPVRAETGYGTSDGTSFATAFVSAACALLLGRRPDLTPAQVGSHLVATARTLGAPPATAAFLDLAAALAALPPGAIS